MDTLKMMVFFFVIIVAFGLRADPPEESWISCDAETKCPEEMQCVKFEEIPTPVCWPANSDPCDYCQGAECSVLESYPPQVMCGNGEEIQPISCKEDADCPEMMFCFDGYCVSGGGGDETSCKNDAGYCVIGETSGFCQCITGYGVAWSEDKPDNPVRDGGGETPFQLFFAPTQDECVAKLVEICGTEVPNVKEECGKELFEACRQSIEWVQGTCFETFPSEEERMALDEGKWAGDWSRSIYHCCRGASLEEVADTLADFKQCVAEHGCDECLRGEDIAPGTPCTEDADCGESGTCVDGTCQWEETPVKGGDEETTDSDMIYTAGNDKNDGTEATTMGAPKESGGSGCSLVLL